MMIFAVGAGIDKSHAARAVEEPKLVATPLRIEPSLEQVGQIPDFPAVWVLPDAVARDLERVLGQGGFSPELAGELVRRLKPGRAEGEMIIQPDAALLDRFTGNERLRWWMILAVHAANRTYRWPIAFRPENLGVVARDPAYAGVLACLRRWSVRFGDRLVFCDLFALEPLFADRAMRAGFFRTMLGAEVLITRQSQLDVRDRDAWSGYWQLQGRFRSLGPFFDAVSQVDDHERIDLAHLLPRLPRALINSFPPDFASTAEPAVETAAASVGFFSMEPEKIEPLETGLSAWLRESCRELAPGESPVFGDILVFGDLERSDWPFAVVYLADGLVFGRRPTLLGPWAVQRQSEIATLNPRLAAQPPRCFRRESTLDEPAPAPFVRRELPGAWKPHPVLRDAAPGPWGRLRYFEILLAPGGDTLEALPVPDADPVWVFDGLDRDEILEQVRVIPMDEPVRAALTRLFEAGGSDDDGRIVVRPDRELVLNTPAEFRRRLFRHLAHGSTATAYAQEVQIPTREPAERWFGPESLAPSARDVVLRLVYPRGGALGLSDYGTLYHAIPDPLTRVSTLRTVSRSPALIVMLEKPQPAEVDTVLAYWRLNQGKGLRRLLESFARSEDLHYLDIIHLLPPLPREFINLYAVQRADAPQASCYWTAMNFAEDRYDPAFLVPPSRSQPQIEAVARRLASDYRVVTDAAGFGDIVAYRRIGGDREVVHVCSHVAAGIVFTKNGYGYSAPWCLMHLEDVDALYLAPGETERLVFRRRD